MSIIPQHAFAHGFVEKPGSRAALCSEAYGLLNLNCGSVMYEPQSLEAKKGFPHDGPADGQIASAGGLFGGIFVYVQVKVCSPPVMICLNQRFSDC